METTLVKLSNDTVSLRALEPEDLSLLYTWENDTSLWELSSTLTPLSNYVLKQYLENSHLDIYATRQLRLMIDTVLPAPPTTTVGCIDLFDFEPYHLRAGVGILIYDKANRHKHYGAGALQLLIAYCFDYLRLNQLYCNIAVDNKHSLALFEQFGFEISGRKRNWLRTATGWKDEYTLQLVQ